MANCTLTSTSVPASMGDKNGCPKRSRDARVSESEIQEGRLSLRRVGKFGPLIEFSIIVFRLGEEL